MVEIADIKDEESLCVWLDALPCDDEMRRKNGVEIAHRAAMRVLPLAWKGYETTEWKQKFSVGALPVIRHSFACELMLASSGSHIAIASSPKVIAPNSSLAGAAIVAAAEAAIGVFGLFYTRKHEKPFSTLGIPTAMQAARAAVYYSNEILFPVDQFWLFVQRDCALIQNGDDPMQAPLWHNDHNPLEREWHYLRLALEASEGAPHWEFWIRWYERALKGEAQDWAGLLTDVALIDDEVWKKGLEAVSERIDALKNNRPRGEQGGGTRGAIRRALAQNALAIAPQADALIHLLDGELERLRGRNPRDEIEQQETERLRAVFARIRGHVEALSTSVGDEPTISEGAVDEAQSLHALFRDEALKWPRDNAADIVDSSWRVVFVGATVGLFVACGLPVFSGLSAGGLLFGGKKLAGIAKTVKDSIN